MRFATAAAVGAKLLQSVSNCSISTTIVHHIRAAAAILSPKGRIKIKGSAQCTNAVCVRDMKPLCAACGLLAALSCFTSVCAFLCTPAVSSVRSLTSKPSLQQQAEAADNEEPQNPDGVTLEGVYRRLKLEVLDLDEGVVGIESRDPRFGIEIVKVVDILRVPSLGLELVEVAASGDGRSERNCGLMTVIFTSELSAARLH
eukprot:17178-Heterococcus_DN1.PRE.2